MEAISDRGRMDPRKKVYADPGMRRSRLADAPDRTGQSDPVIVQKIGQSLKVGMAANNWLIGD